MTSPNVESSCKSQKPSRTFIQHLEELGHQIFYFTLFCTGHLGAYILLVPVIFCYVLCSRKIHRNSLFYLEKRFPDSGLFLRWIETFKLVLSFGRTLVDRAWLGMKKDSGFAGYDEGMAGLKDVIAQKKGVVLLTAHVGNWQTALSNICKLPVQINSLMHYEAETVAKHYFDLKGQSCPFNIISTEGFMGGVVEATAALQRGEVVTIMGDRSTGGQSLEVDFLGRPARFPVSTFAMAASTGASVGVAFAAKTGKSSYIFKVYNIFRPEYSDRESRAAELKKSVQKFVSSLEEYLQKYPYQWYNFYNFWKK